ncbi:fructosamine kinase family protein [Pleionea sediminis]|uniref:fructosamine kinase family protein n=1 Tax=Pleionea sediminis TaxID=2569479 RepID=UPI001186729B|nr:fructosamine kinase family protein [Pleionea sediminis]
MSLSTSMKAWIQGHVPASIANISSVSGGCINDAYQIELTNGKNFFLKCHSGVSMFGAEARGLAAINDRVVGFAPEVIAFEEHGLLLEYRSPTAPDNNYWQELGEKLALLHETPEPSFGFSEDNYCGETRQVNTPKESGIEFFREHRLGYQADIALNNGLLDQALHRSILELADRLERWIPELPAVLIHGDLWSGNAMNTTQGATVIDPACYFGWAEADLAMTTLFGGFHGAFYEAYAANAKQYEPSWRERAPIYNLYHLLNHLNLFGGHYLSSIKQVVAKFG